MKTKQLIGLFVAIILFMLAGVYFTFYSDSAVRWNATQTALQQFAQAVDSQDRAKISAALTTLLTDDAKVRLNVAFSSITSSNLRPMSQDFDKASFIAFIDNVIYPLNDYHVHFTLSDLALEKNIAKAQVNGTQRANGPSFFSGVALEVRYSGDTRCNGEVVFTEKMQARLKAANCDVLLRSMAKGDAAGAAIDKAQQIHDAIQQP